MTSMLMVTLAGLRTRWLTLIGSFVALTLGVGLLATMGLALASTLEAPAQPPERFAAAPVVVRGPDELRVAGRHRTLAQPPGVPPATAAAFPGGVQDRSFPVRTAGSVLVGHPWPVAAYGGYRLTAGRGPGRPGEVVVSGPATLVGSTLAAATALGPSSWTVVGVTGPVPYEKAVFFSVTEAARLSPRIDNLVLPAVPAGLTGVQVLTGDARRRADPGPDRDAEALVAVNALLGTAGGVTTFVSVFVVAATFAFSVAQRRREIALLRTAGATAGQVRRMLLTEAAVVGVLAGAAGCLLGSRAAPRLARALVTERLAPAWFTVGGHGWPYQVAFWTGLGVALAGAGAAAARAGRVRPLEALRSAAVENGPLPRGRLLAGAALLATALGRLAWRLATDPGDALHRKTYVTQPMLLITAVALLTPLLIRPLLRITRLPGVTGLLVRANATAGLSRTAAVAAPVLITVALAGSLLGATATIDRARDTEARTRTAADLIIEADGGLDARTLAGIRSVPGATVLTSAPTTVSALEDGTALIGWPAEAVDPATLADLRDLPVRAGRPADLDDNSIVVTEEWADHTVGDRVGVWLGDGRPTTLRIVAVLATGTGSDGAYVTAANAPGVAPDRVEVKGNAPAVRAAVREAQVTVLTRTQWLAREHPAPSRSTRAGLLLVLGIALVYAAISVATTLAMATSDRSGELAALRRAGATRGQVLTLIAAEALTVTGLGALLGLAVTLADLLGLRGALALLSVRSPIVLPWAAIGLSTAACAAVALLAALLPAAMIMLGRGRAGR